MSRIGFTGLGIMAGGEPAAFEAARGVFEPVGATFAPVGRHGAGQVVKAANQLVVGGTYAGPPGGGGVR